MSDHLSSQPRAPSDPPHGTDAGSATTLPKSRRYQEIDVLRGLAALWVVLSHYLPFWNRYLGTAPIVVPNEWGWYAVKLFFMISGFVIFMTLARCRSVGEFALLRATRLYPAYWASLALTATLAALLFHEPPWIPALAANATMFQEFLGFANYDEVYWSLTVELAFYFMAAAVFSAGLHGRPVLLALLWLSASSIWGAFGGRTEALDRDWLSRILVLDFAPYFAIGMVFYDALKGLSRVHVATIAAALAVEALLGGLSGLIVGATCVGLMHLALTGRLAFIVSGPTLWLGSISYALYLVHRNFGYHLLTTLHETGATATVAVPLTIASALALATALTMFIEKPALKRLRPLYAARFARHPRGLP